VNSKPREILRTATRRVSSPRVLDPVTPAPPRLRPHLVLVGVHISAQANQDPHRAAHRVHAQRRAIGRHPCVGESEASWPGLALLGVAGSGRDLVLARPAPRLSLGAPGCAEGCRNYQQQTPAGGPEDRVRREPRWGCRICRRGGRDGRAQGCGCCQGGAPAAN
jgi:hypothetical protein